MKGHLKALVGFLILFSTPVFSGEVTDKEWNVTGLIVTYYEGTSSLVSVVSCTAFNDQGKAIGGGKNMTDGGGITRVSIRVPEKYAGQELKVTCK